MSTRRAGSKPHTLLLVEDDAITAMVERKTLEQAGYVVMLAHSGEAALEMAVADHTIDLVLMDIDLGPGIDGTEAAVRIRAARDVPIVFLSSHTEADIVRRTERITSYGYIVKSSGDAVLLASIRMAFRLYESHRLIDDAFTYSISGVSTLRFLYDDEGNPFDFEYLRINEAFVQQTGLSGEDLVGHTVRELFPGEAAEAAVQLCVDILAGKTDPRQTLYFEPTSSWFELSVFATRNNEFTVILNNVTEQATTSEALAEIEERYRHLFKTIPQGVVHQAANGSIISANPAAERILGLTAEQMQGLTSMDPRWHMADEDGQLVEGPDHPAMVALRTGTTVGPVIRSVFRPRTESIVWIRITAVPLFRDNASEPYQVYATFEDISEQRRADDEHRETVDRLLAEKETLLRELRHRVKNNMSTITSLLSLQMSTVGDETASSVLKDTLSRMNSLQLLFERLHADAAQEGSSIPEYLNTLVTHAIRLFPYGERVRIDGTLEDRLYDVKRLSALGLIVNELVTNTMKYAFRDHPEPVLTISGENHNDHYILDVADNGPGMVDAPSDQHSSGLGMTIVRALCEQIDARMAFENGTGVRVRLEFPVP